MLLNSEPQRPVQRQFGNHLKRVCDRRCGRRCGQRPARRNRRRRVSCADRPLPHFGIAAAHLAQLTGQPPAIVRGGLYISFGTASEIGDRSSLAILAGRLHENFRDCGRLTGELREMRCRYAEMVAVGEHRESDTTITVWDDEKNAWRSIPLTRLTELRIDGERLEVGP